MHWIAIFPRFFENSDPAGATSSRGNVRPPDPRGRARALAWWHHAATPNSSATVSCPSEGRGQWGGKLEELNCLLHDQTWRCKTSKRPVQDGGLLVREPSAPVIVVSWAT